MTDNVPTQGADTAAAGGFGLRCDTAGNWSLRHVVELGTPQVSVPATLILKLEPFSAGSIGEDTLAQAKRQVQAVLATLDLEPARRQVRSALDQPMTAEERGKLLECWRRHLKVTAGVEPQQLQERLAAGTRQWQAQRERGAKLRALSRTLHFSTYPDLFRQAREMGRQITLLVGPPNSGKTYYALNELAAARSGVYLAPLRLLALEGREKLAERGCEASLITGEERDIREGATHVASTIEMLNPAHLVECAVIDEAQMLYDRERGWAWTQALVGVPAHKVLVVCSEYAVPALKGLLEPLGEPLQIRHFQRKQQLRCLRSPVRLRDLEPGDAVIAFSRKDVLQLREVLLAMGRTVSVIYGALSPEVRRKEAERFAAGEAQILVATDAIGMGLNLPVRRVLFSRLSKWDGLEERPLGVPEFHQIAGRAGRFGLHESGEVGCLAGYARHSSPQAWFDRKPQAPDNDSRAWVAPGLTHVQMIADTLQIDQLADILEVFHMQVDLEDQRFRCVEAGMRMELARDMDRVRPRLDLELRFAYANAPVDAGSAQRRALLLRWATSHAAGQLVPLPASLIPHDGAVLDLATAEDLSKSVSLYCWLALRFPQVYPQIERAQQARQVLNRRIEELLRDKPSAGRGGQRGPRRGWYEQVGLRV